MTSFHDIYHFFTAFYEFSTLHLSVGFEFETNKLLLLNNVSTTVLEPPESVLVYVQNPFIYRNHDLTFRLNLDAATSSSLRQINRQNYLQNRREIVLRSTDHHHQWTLRSSVDVDAPLEFFHTEFDILCLPSSSTYIECKWNELPFFVNHHFQMSYEAIDQFFQSFTVYALEPPDGLPMFTNLLCHSSERISFLTPVQMDWKAQMTIGCDVAASGLIMMRLYAAFDPTYQTFTEFPTAVVFVFDYLYSLPSLHRILSFHPTKTTSSADMQSWQTGMEGITWQFSFLVLMLYNFLVRDRRTHHLFFVRTFLHSIFSSIPNEWQHDIETHVRSPRWRTFMISRGTESDYDRFLNGLHDPSHQRMDTKWKTMLPYTPEEDRVFFEVRFFQSLLTHRVKYRVDNSSSKEIHRQTTPRVRIQ